MTGDNNVRLGLFNVWQKAVRIIPHATEGIPYCGSFEVMFRDGRESVYFYWDDVPGRRLRTEAMTQEQAKKAAQELARAEQEKLK